MPLQPIYVELLANIYIVPFGISKGFFVLMCQHQKKYPLDIRGLIYMYTQGSFQSKDLLPRFNE
jgi:hypothetical protein